MKIGPRKSVVNRTGKTAAFEGGAASRGCNGGCPKSCCGETDRIFSPKTDRDFVLTQHPDVVVDASQLERSLYMVAETIPLAAPMVIALNKTDVAKRLGKKPDAKKLAKLTGIPAIAMDAAKRKGIDLLLQPLRKWQKTINADTANPIIHRPSARPMQKCWRRSRDFPAIAMLRNGQR